MITIGGYYKIKLVYKSFLEVSYNVVAKKFEDALHYAQERYVEFISDETESVTPDQIQLLSVELVNMKMPIIVLEEVK